jgi:hypothetical protein
MVFAVETAFETAVFTGIRFDKLHLLAPLPCTVQITAEKLPIYLPS